MDMEKIEAGGEKHQEWLSEDEGISVTMCVFGGEDWQNVWVREIDLFVLFDSTLDNRMKVLSVKTPDSEVILHTVVVTLPVDGGGMVQYTYSSDYGGKRETDDVSFDLPCDLPERIDVEETVRLFLEQMEARDFSRPFLVPN